MSKVSAISRRLVRNFSTRTEIDWSRPIWSSSPEITAHVNKLRSWVSMSDSMFEKYQSPPGPVDFASAKKKVRDTELIDMLEAMYKSSAPPAEVHSMPAEEHVAEEYKMAYLKELDAFHKEFVPVLEEEINFQKNNRTSMDTTMLDMTMNYPLIHEEIEDELERREWFKDSGIESNK